MLVADAETEDPNPDGVGQPILSVPTGTRWVKLTSPHPGQVVKIKKSTDLAVYYTQEKPGESQGKRNGTHRSDRPGFLRDYEPYTKRDRLAAEQPEGRHIQPQEEVAELLAEPADVVQPEPVAEEAPVPLELEFPEKPPVRRTRQAELADPEQQEIVELWRKDAGNVDDIARTFNVTTQTVYSTIANLASDEYRLWRVVEQLKRNPGPIPAYRVSQWMHLKASEVEELCGSEAAQKVLRYTIEVRDPAKPWVKTRMLELIPPEAPAPPTEAPEEPAVPATNAVVATEPPVSLVISEPTSVRPVRTRRWRISVLTTVEDVVEADNLLEAHAEAMKKYPTATDVVGVIEER